MDTQGIDPRPVRWCKSKCKGKTCDGGSHYTYVKRAYALAVSVALNGHATCAICDIAPVSMEVGEVDRTEDGCYRPGQIALTCHRCNNERTGMPLFNAQEYARAVREASRGIVVIGPTEARKLWESARPEYGETVKQSRFYE